MFHSCGSSALENMAFSESFDKELRKMSQEPQNSASNDVRLSGMENLEERRGSPG